MTPYRIKTLSALAFLWACSIFIVLSGCGASNDTEIQDAVIEAVEVTDATITDATITDANAPQDAYEADAVLPEPVPLAFSIGYAQRDMTPEMGTIMGGFGGPGDERRSTGVNDPLMAQAILFTNDVNQAMLMISIDSAGMFFEFGEWGPGIREAREAIAVALKDHVDLEPHQIVITSSHTHAGTDLGGLNQGLGLGVDVDLLYDTQWHLVQVALAAAEAVAPAEISFITSELNGWTKRDSDCSPVLDNQTSSMLVQWTDSSILPLYLINFANHPTVLGSSNTAFSSDFVWGLRTAATAQGTRAMFIQGFIAAVHGSYSQATTSGFDRALEYGQVLYEAATSGDVRPNEANFGIESKEVIFGCNALDSFLSRVFRFLDMPKRTVLDRDDTLFIKSIPVSWHRIGDAEFIVWPGEPSPEYSRRLKALMKSPNKFAIGLGNDAVGYIVEPESVEQDTSGRLSGYELMMGLGIEAGPCAWAASESLGWFSPQSNQPPND
jgi:hypothetical protein